MPLAIGPLGHDQVPEPETPGLYSKQYRHSIVVSTYQPETSMLSMVQGTPIEVEYYRQRLERDELPTPFDPDDAATYQSYDRIKHLIIKKEGSGSFNFDPQTGQSDKKYSAYVAFDKPPIKFDVFVLDIGDGNAGLAQIFDPPEIPEFTANKVYKINFQIVGILTEQIFNELERRTQEEWVYSKDSALMGGVSIVTPQDFDMEGELFQWRTTIANWIMKNFWWNPERTIAFPLKDGGEKNSMVYDQYLVKFINAVFEPDLRTTYPIIHMFSTQYGGRDFGMNGTINIWDVLLYGDWNLLSQCTNEATVIGTNRLVNTRLYGNLRSSKFEWFVTTDPKEYKLYHEYFNMDGYPILRPSPEKKITYLFSEEFYKGNPQDEFEKLIVDVLKKRIVPRDRLLAYCKTYFSLERLDQLYHGAILVMLIQASRRFGVPS
jgi:hypothetical protein